jgi:hypothetical protein
MGLNVGATLVYAKQIKVLARNNPNPIFLFFEAHLAKGEPNQRTTNISFIKASKAI